MFGIWSALTPLGRLAVAGAVVLGLGFFFLIYNGSSDDPQGFQPGLLRTLTATSGLQLPSFATNTPSLPQTAGSPLPDDTAVVEQPTATPEASDDEPTPEPTEDVPVEEPTATPVPPTPEPTLPPPTPTPGCLAAVSIAGETATGSLTCGGEPQSGVTMNAFFSYDGGGTACLGVTDGSGSASCTPNAANLGNVVSVQACFAHQSGQVCATASP